MSEADREILTVLQVCDWLQIQKSWLYDMVELDKIPHFKLGRQLRFRRRELEVWIDGLSRASIHD